MMGAAAVGIELVERGLSPDAMVRWGIRRLCAKRLQEEAARGVEAIDAFTRAMDQSEIAPIPEKANEQHYEVPPAFFELVLGKNLKYSSCLFGDGVQELDAAEDAMLATTAERAMLADGQRILELGCGWGSLTLWAARRFPGSRITAVSNSAPQRAFILSRAKAEGLPNVHVITADINTFKIDERFDRVVSVEMFEHMRNWRTLLRRIAGWMSPEGRFFMHIFCHRAYAYEFQAEGEDDWMGRHFFSSGIMPSYDLPIRFQDALRLEQHWAVSGAHYQQTAEAWLRNLDKNRPRILKILQTTYGHASAERWLRRWRVFFMACAELFGYGGGSEWHVGHYRFVKPA